MKSKTLHCTSGLVWCSFVCLVFCKHGQMEVDSITHLGYFFLK